MSRLLSLPLVDRLKRKPVTRRLPISTLLFLTMAVFANPLAAETDPRAKPLFERFAKSVVRFEAVIELFVTATMGDKEKSMPSKDVPIRGVATLVGKDGVFVASLSDFDASSAMDGRTINGPKGQKAVLDVSVGEIKDLRFVLADGSEIAGEIVLKDQAIDLVVLRAKTEAWAERKPADLVAVDVAASAHAELLDEILVVGLSGETLAYAPLASLAGIIVKTTQPPLLYRPTFAQKGGPAFLLSGEFIGIGAQLVYRGKLARDPVIVPTTEVAALLQQALGAAQP